MSYEILWTRHAQRDLSKIKRNAVLLKKLSSLLDMIKENPFISPPPFEKLGGDLKGFYSRRLNIQHRLVYKVIPKARVVQILICWTHYE